MNGWRCPEWCAADHQCTVRQQHPSGVHRSDPIRWSTAYGSLVAVRNQDLTGRDWLEIHAHTRLDRCGAAVQEQASHIAVAVDLAIRSIALPPLRTHPPLTQEGGHLR